MRRSEMLPIGADILATAREREASETLTAATPEQIDLCKAMRMLCNHLPLLIAKGATGEASAIEWLTAANAFSEIGEMCRRQVAPSQPLDVGDSGGR